MRPERRAAARIEPMRLLIATANDRKGAELERMLRGLDLDLLSLRDLAPLPPAVEDGASFEDNARRKALHYAALTGELCLADDSGLEVDALGGRPGVHSARYAGPGATDASNRSLLLRELEGVSEPRRTARFRCALALARPGLVLFECCGATEGRILTKERGFQGFGYDPLFLSDDLRQCFGEADDADKDRVSHRGRALRELRGWLAPGALADEPGQDPRRGGGSRR